MRSTFVDRSQELDSGLISSQGAVSQLVNVQGDPAPSNRFRKIHMQGSATWMTATSRSEAVAYA